MKKTAAIVASFMILVIAGGVAVVQRMDQVPQPVTGFAASRGWCCIRGGSACMPNHTPFSCGDTNGIAFSSTEENCTLACTSFPTR